LNIFRRVFVKELQFAGGAILKDYLFAKAVVIGPKHMTRTALEA